MILENWYNLIPIDGLKQKKKKNREGQSTSKRSYISRLQVLTLKLEISGLITNLPGAMNFHIQDAALKSFPKSYVWTVKNRDEKAVSKGERRGLSVATVPFISKHKGPTRRERASVSRAAAAQPRLQPGVTSLAAVSSEDRAKGTQATPECSLALLSPPPMIYISGAFRGRSGILYLKVTVSTNEFQSFILKCEFLPVCWTLFRSTKQKWRF